MRILVSAESPTSRTLELRAESSAPRVARSAVASWLHEISGATRDAILLVVSELVTNAVKYGAAPISLLVERSSKTVTITVADAGRRRPRRREPDVHGGMGLHIVHTICQQVVTSKAQTRVSCKVPIAP